MPRRLTNYLIHFFFQLRQPAIAWGFGRPGYGGLEQSNETELDKLTATGKIQMPAG